MTEPWWPTEDDIDAQVRDDLDRWESEGVEMIGVPTTPKHYQRKNHWTHLSERRTQAELERLLAARLEVLRAGKLHSTSHG